MLKYEELLVESEDLGRTENEKIFVEKDAPLHPADIEEKLRILQDALKTQSNRKVKEALHRVVPTYHTPEEVNSCVADQ